MPEIKTMKTGASVSDFISAIEDHSTVKDCREIAKMMRKATGKPPKLWGTSIVGFGSYKYRNGEWFLTGFSPRKQNLTLYLLCGFDHDEALAAKLGKYKTGKSCLYIKRLNDVDRSVLQKILDSGVKKVAAMDIGRT